LNDLTMKYLSHLAFPVAILAAFGLSVFPNSAYGQSLDLSMDHVASVPRICELITPPSSGELKVLDVRTLISDIPGEFTVGCTVPASVTVKTIALTQAPTTFDAATDLESLTVTVYDAARRTLARSALNELSADNGLDQLQPGQQDITIEIEARAIQDSFFPAGTYVVQTDITIVPD
jgi:hypothetical protein